MIRTSKLARLLALLFAFTLIAAACGSDSDDASGDEAETDANTEEEGGDEEETATTLEEVTTTAPPAPDVEEGDSGGTLIWAHEQEPPDMHLDDPNNNLSITSWIRSAMIEGLYGITGSTEYYPELLLSLIHI